jgi:hypothetical protein
VPSTEVGGLVSGGVARPKEREIWAGQPPTGGRDAVALGTDVAVDLDGLLKP